MSPGRVRFEDLPAGERRRYADSLKGAKSSAPAPATTAASSEPRPRWRCHRCGEISDTFTATERHASKPGHGHYQQVGLIP